MTVTMTCPVCGEILFDLAPEKRGMGMPCSRCGAALFFPGELGENTPQEEQAVTVPSEEEVRRIGTIWEADPDTDFELDLRVVDAALADSDAVLMDDEGDAPPSTEDSAWLIELNKREGELHSDSDVDAEPAGDSATDLSLDEAAAAAASLDAESSANSDFDDEQRTEVLEWGDVTSQRSAADPAETQFELETPTPVVAGGNGTIASRRQRELELRTLRVYVSVTADLAAERLFLSRFLTRLATRFQELLTLEYVIHDHSSQSSDGVLDVENFGPGEADLCFLLLGRRAGLKVPPGVEPVAGRSGTELELATVAKRSWPEGRLRLVRVERLPQSLSAAVDRHRHEQEERLLDGLVTEWVEADGAPLVGVLQSVATSNLMISSVEGQLRKAIEALVAERNLTPRESAGDEPAKWWTAGSPYRGAAPYEAASADLFEGRNDQVLAATTLLRDQAARGRPVLVISGPQASGKTSLARAGIKPVLMSRGVVGEAVDWRRGYLRAGDIGESAVESLAATIMDYDVLPELATLGMTPTKLAHLLRKNPPAACRNVQGALSKVAESGGARGRKGNLLLVLDALEELIANEYLSFEDKSLFWTSLAKLAATGDVWLVMIVRGDFLAELAAIPELASIQVEKSQFPIVAPTRDELERIVQIPSEGAGLWFGKDPGSGKWLDQQIADDAVASGGSLFDLSLTMQALYEKKTPRGKITQTAYDDLGPVGRTVATLGDRLYDSLTPAVQAALPRLVRELVEVEPELGRRLARAVPLSRLKADTDLLAMCEALQKVGFVTARRQVGGASMVRLASLQLLESWPRLAEAYESAREMPLLEASGEVPIPSAVLDMPLSELAKDVEVSEEAGEIAAGPETVQSRDRFSRLLQNWPPLGAAAATAVVVFLIGAWILQWGPFGKSAAEPTALARTEVESTEASPDSVKPSSTAAAASQPAGADNPPEDSANAVNTPAVGAPAGGTEVALAPTNITPAAQPDGDSAAPATPVVPAELSPAAPKPDESPAPAATANPAAEPAPEKTMPAEPAEAPETPRPADVVASVTAPQVPTKSGAKPLVPNPEAPAAGDSATTAPTTPLGEFVDAPEIVNSLKLKLRKIPSGTFRMGSPKSEASRNSDELAREVTLTKSFHMGIHEVTQGQYEQVMGKNPSGFKGKTLPVETVSWLQAVEFCERLSARPEEREAGRQYRLPTEAEWEYACRGGAATVFGFGDKATSRDANFDGTQPYGGLAGPDLAGTIVVGSYKPNEFGLFDMHGNVSEWCQDWFARSVDVSALVDPQGPNDGQRRVIRGGSWLSSGAECRSAWRGSESPNRFDSILGFRVVCVPAE